MTEILFRSAHEALTFAFRFSHDQSPRTPMTRLMQGGSIGAGKGLIGMDGAGQAGMILAALVHLKPDEKHVLVVRYGDLKEPCACCGQMAPTREWADSQDALSHADELCELPRVIRHAVVEKVICRRKGMRVASLAGGYEVTERTVQRRMRDFKARIGKVENAAIAWMDDHLSARGLLEVA
jgi:hypothetical protein